MKEKINKYNILSFEIIALICSFIFLTIYNINMNEWIKYFIIPMSLLLISCIYIIKNNNLEVNKKAYILLIPIILMLLSGIIVDLDYSNMTIYIILPLVISMFLFILTNPNYKISLRSLLWIFKLIPDGFIDNFEYFKYPNKKNKINNIIIGCIIGIPIAIVLLILLGNADKYFNVFINNLINNVSTIFNFEIFIKNIIWPIALIFITFYVIYINIIRHNKDELEEKEIKKINNVVVSTILIIINCVFVLFLLSELSKITTNFLNIPSEYTYAKYAREGFFQLLIVTSINFSITSFFIYETDIIKKNKLVKNLLLLLIIFSIMLIFNSYYRMFLYINSYGFTILRLQVMLFLTMEFIIFLLLIKKIINNIKHNETKLFTTIILTTYILNLYLCNESFINLIS